MLLRYATDEIVYGNIFVDEDEERELYADVAVKLEFILNLEIVEDVDVDEGAVVVKDEDVHANLFVDEDEYNFHQKSTGRSNNITD